MHCAAVESLNRQTQLIIVEEAQKAGKGGRRGCIVSGRLSCVCVCVLVKTIPARAAWQDDWHLTSLLPSFLPIQADWLPLWSQISSQTFLPFRLLPSKVAACILLHFVAPNEVTCYVIVPAKHSSHLRSVNLMAFRLFKQNGSWCETADRRGREDEGLRGWGARRRAAEQSYEKALRDLRRRGIFPPGWSIPPSGKICLCIQKKNNKSK